MKMYLFQKIHGSSSLNLAAAPIARSFLGDSSAKSSPALTTAPGHKVQVRYLHPFSVLIKPILNLCKAIYTEHQDIISTLISEKD